jgi:hypothetical protein
MLDVLHRPKRKDDKIFTHEGNVRASKKAYGCLILPAPWDHNGYYHDRFAAAPTSTLRPSLGHRLRRG